MKSSYIAFLVRKNDEAFRSRHNEDNDDIYRTAPKESFEVRRVGAFLFSPEYRYYVLSFYDEDCNEIALIYTNMIIEIKGENLKELVLAIRRKNLIYMQQFHPLEFEQPEEGTPVIRKVNVVMGRFYDEILEKLNSGLKN